MKAQMYYVLFPFLIFISAITLSQPLTTVTGKRIYEHHSSSINGNHYYGTSANGFQSGYDFVNNTYKNTTTSTDHAHMDLVETNGIFGNGNSMFGFTSDVSTLWQGTIYGNGTTKYYKALSSFDFQNASSVSDLAAAYNASAASVTVTTVQDGAVYIAKVRNSDLYVAMKITKINALTSQQVQDLLNQVSIYADVYFDFDYKYGTLATGITETENQDKVNLKLFPNPAADKMNYTLTLPFNAEVIARVTDMLGREIISETRNMPPGENRFTLDVSGYPKGIYILSLSAEKKNYRDQKRFIVE